MSIFVKYLAIIINYSVDCDSKIDKVQSPFCILNSAETNCFFCYKPLPGYHHTNQREGVYPIYKVLKEKVSKNYLEEVNKPKPGFQRKHF